MSRTIAGYGWKRDLPMLGEVVIAREHLKVDRLSAAIDLRPGFAPCYDQGTLGSCVGNSTAGAFQYMRRKLGFPDWVPSRLWIYLLARANEGEVAVDAGAEIRDAYVEVLKRGAMPETEWPYDEAKFAQWPPMEAWRDAAEHRALAQRVVPQTEDGIKSCLAAGLPFTFGFTVYDGFESDEVANTGVLNLPNLATEKPAGGHAVTAAGYDANTERLIARNSWGPKWGQAGYFTIPLAYVLDPNLASDMRAFVTIQG